MSKDLNRVQLLGRLGSEPELRYLDTGQALTTFSVATSRRWKDAAGQDQEETEWSRIVAWGRLAEIGGQYLRKGARVFVEGRLRTRSWEDAQTAERRSLTEIVADDLILLDQRTVTAPESAASSDAAEADVTVPSATPAAHAGGPPEDPDRPRARQPPHGARRGSTRPRLMSTVPPVADAEPPD